MNTLELKGLEYVKSLTDENHLGLYRAHQKLLDTLRENQTDEKTMELVRKFLGDDYGPIAQENKRYQEVNSWLGTIIGNAKAEHKK